MEALDPEDVEQIKQLRRNQRRQRIANRIAAGGVNMSDIIDHNSTGGHTHSQWLDLAGIATVEEIEESGLASIELPHQAPDTNLNTFTTGW